MSVVMILHVVSVLKIDLSPRVVYVLRHVKMISMQMITQVYVPIVIQHVQHARFAGEHIKQSSHQRRYAISTGFGTG